MGMSISASHLLFFIAAVVVAGMVVSVVIGGIDSISTGIRERSDSIRKDMGSRIDIINDPTMVPYNETSHNLTIYVKNTAMERLDINDLTMVLDGRMLTNFTWEYVDNAAFLDDNAWGPGEVVDITINTTMTDGLHSVQASLFGQVSSRMDFAMDI